MNSEVSFLKKIPTKTKNDSHKNTLESYKNIYGSTNRRTQTLIHTPQKPLFEKAVFSQKVESHL